MKTGRKRKIPERAVSSGRTVPRRPGAGSGLVMGSRTSLAAACVGGAPRRRGLGQQFVEVRGEAAPFGVLQMQLAVPVVADAALLVDQVNTGPELIAPRLPNAAVVINDDGEFQAVVPSLGADAGCICLVGELRRVDADDRQPLAGVFLLPGLVDRVIVDAIDTAKGPEMDDHDLAAQIRELEGLALDPGHVL